MKMKDNPVPAPPLTGRLGEQSLQPIDFQSLFDNMREGFALFRMIYENDAACDFQCLAVNPAFLSITGVKDPVGRMASELIPRIREDQLKLFEIYDRLVSTGQPKQFDFFVKDLGIWLSILVYGSEQDSFTVLIKDITQRKELETNLKINEKLFRQIALNFDDVIWEIDHTGLFTFCSANIVKLTGYTREELKGRMYFFDLLDPAEGEKMKSWLPSIFMRLEPYNNLVVCSRHLDGRKIYVEIKGLPLNDKNGILLGYKGTASDVTVREHAFEPSGRANSNLPPSF